MKPLRLWHPTIPGLVVLVQPGPLRRLGLRRGSVAALSETYGAAAASPVPR